MFQTLDPFVSSTDISPGTEWFGTIAATLQASALAIICVTPENVGSPWLHWEAGAIGMTITAQGGQTRPVVPYVLGLGLADIPAPFSMYQGVTATEDGTRRLVSILNEVAPVPNPNLQRNFEMNWPSLDARINSALEALDAAETKKALRSDREILEEILELARASARSDGSSATGGYQNIGPALTTLRPSASPPPPPPYRPPREQEPEVPIENRDDRSRSTNGQY
jgi:hypothetical protein